MNKKTIIQLIVISGAFIVSGIVLYKGFFSSSSSNSGSLEVAVTPGAPVVIKDILPYGETFNYKKIDDLKSRFQYNIVTYPVVNPATDVGKPSVSDLIQPPPEAPAQ